MRLLSLFIVCFFISLLQGNAQTDSMASPAGHFSTSGGRIFWMGNNYRKEWNTPVKARVINLATEKGGLTPIKLGGGKQTKSLRLEDASGREYTLRSIQKFITDKTLPGDLQSEAAADLVSDGISASYPFASLSMQTLADAAGVPYGKVELVYIGDDAKLGQFKADFTNMLATLEERVPDNVKKPYNTEEVAEKLEEDNDNTVDQQALLRARLLDMYVMDLDRHEGQWNWGATDNANGKGKTFFPIPKDRDQAFYINQGLLPGLVKGRSLVPQLEGFKPAAKSITRFNFAARNLDRFFLNELTEQDWRSAAEKMVSQMTDAVIDKAMLAQPGSIRSISSEKIAATLKARRNNLVAEAVQYYNFISQTVSISGSDKKELYDITRNSDGSVAVVVSKIDKDGGPSTKMYERKFEPLITKELRIYGLDGQDKFVVHGDVDKIKLRLIGGGGEDVFENPESRQSGAMVYDKKDGGNKITGRFTNRMSNDSMVNSFDRLGYKYPFQSVFGTIGYNPDDGIFLGPTFKYIRHGFRKKPYKSLHQFKALYAFSTKAVNLKYNNEFISVMGNKTDIVTDIEYKGPDNTSNFFGYGVNSVYDKTKPGKFKFYRIRYDLGEVSLQIRQRFSDKVMLTFGPMLQWYSMDKDEELNKTRNVVLNTVTSGLNPSTVFEKQLYFGAQVSLIVDTRNNNVLPDKGINWVTTAKIVEGQNKNNYDKVTMLNSDFSFYLNLVPDRLTFADRVGAGITLGDGFEFFQAQYLGSDENLRGYRKQRFAGKSKFYNQAEMRLRLANFRTYLFPAAFGILAFVDAGRVWVDNDSDKKFFSGYGGGVWFSPLRRLMISVSYAISSEDNIPLVALGWKF
ncbi:MAG: hypothetical protein ABI688_02215 [Bacteroidota bacterium]